MSRVASVRLLVAIAVGCLAVALAMRGASADRSLFLWINDAGWTWATPAWLSGITILGNGLVAVMVLSPTLLRTPAILLAGLYATPFGLLLSRIPKLWVDSPRPAAVLDPATIHVDGMLLMGHNSLPSGHSTTAFLLVGVLVLAQPPAAQSRAAAWLVACLAVGVGVAVALSRIAVGAHWPSDVLAGAGLGLLSGAAGTAVQQRWPLPYAATQPALAVGVLVAAALLMRADLGYPLAQPLQRALALLGAAFALAVLWRWHTARHAARQRTP